MLRPSLLLASALAALLAPESEASPSSVATAYVSSATDPTPTCSISPSPEDMYRLLTIATDPTCAQHGLGCISDICRYCRLKRNEAYSNLLICSAIDGFDGGAFDPSDVIDDGPAFSLQCVTTVSAGDAAVGINITTDVSCTLGGVGCLSDLCRYCKVRDTPQSTNFIPCSDVDTNNGDDVFFTPLPVAGSNPSGGPVIASTDRPTLDVIPISALTTSAPTTTAPVATTVKPSTTPPTAPPLTTAPPTTLPPTTAPPTTAPPTTAPPTTAPPTTALPTTIPPTTAPPTTAPPTTAPPTTVPPTTVPPTTAPPTTKPPTVAPPTTAPPLATVDACATSVSSGDNAVGISAFTDAGCRTGGLGCFTTACRFCKTFDSPQSSYLYACPSTQAPAPTTQAPVPTTQAPVPTTQAPVPTTQAPVPTTQAPVPTTQAPVPTTKAPAPTTQAPAPTTQTPAPTTQAPVPTTQVPVPTTTAPVTPAPTTRDACAAAVSSGDNAVGIFGVTDTKCQAGGLGCFSAACRFCKSFDTPQSSYLLPCPAAATAAPVPTTAAPVPTTTAPPPTTTAPTPPPTTRDACAATVSSGDNAVGISAYTDTVCRTGGLGCFSTSCRFCKTLETPQSQQFLVCPSQT